MRIYKRGLVLAAALCTVFSDLWLSKGRQQRDKETTAAQTETTTVLPSESTEKSSSESKREKTRYLPIPQDGK